MIPRPPIPEPLTSFLQQELSIIEPDAQIEFVGNPARYGQLVLDYI